MTTPSKFLIGPIGFGLSNNQKPWSNPADSWEFLNNAYQFRGRLIRRSGYKKLGRLKKFVDDSSLGNSGASPWDFNIYSTLVPPITTPFSQIVPGSVIITMSPTTLTGSILGYTIASDCEVETTTTAGLTTGDSITISGVTVVPGSGPALINGGPYNIEVIDATHFKLGVDSHDWGVWESGGTWTYTGTTGHQFFDQGDGTLATNPPDPGVNFGTIDYLTGNISITYTGGPGVATVAEFQYYPGLPVMGLRTQESIDINPELLIAFDTKDAYLWSGTSFSVLPSVMPVTWSGTDYQFFYSINYANAFWATNSKPGLHGAAISGITNAAAPTAEVTTVAPHNFTTGQTVVFINVQGMTEINGLSDTITVTGANTFTLDTIDTGGFGVYTGGGFALNSSVSVTGQDGIRYYGILSNGTGWANYNPPIDLNNALAGCLLMFAYRGYLVFLNTTEGNENGLFNYGNRARWTQIGTPYYSSPEPIDPAPQGVDVKTARDDLFGRGGANDAPTNEVIVGAAFIRDILVVYFENSTWRLRFVNNAQNPFVWERVNVELGSKSTFSTIPFDKGLMAIGTRGIIISDGNDTVRVDEQIPDAIFDIRQSNQGLQRVCGIRTFRSKLNYWTFPSTESIEKDNISIYPDKVLVYNYDSKQWSFFDDTFTCFGYYYESSPGVIWNDLSEAWSSYTKITWNSGVSEQGYENVVAGNQQGYVLILETNGGQNGASLSISAISGTVFTSTNNNLPDGSWIKLTGITGTTDDNGVSLNERNFKVNNPNLDPNNFTLSEFKPIVAPNAVGSSYSYDIEYSNIVIGSLTVTVGSLTFTDPDLNGSLTVIGNTSTGTIDYETGQLTLSFSSPIGSTSVIVHLVTLDPQQGLSIVGTTGTYMGSGEIIRISNYNIQSKLFNFFPQNQRSRLSYIDFYVNATSNGEFTCNILGDSSNEILNLPFEDNPFSNVVQTSINPIQIGEGTETIYRLYCDAIAQTIQFQFTMADYQQAVDVINSSDLEILALMVSARPGGRLG